MVQSGNVTGVGTKSLNVQSFSARTLDATATAQPYTAGVSRPSERRTRGQTPEHPVPECPAVPFCRTSTGASFAAMPSTEAKLLSDFLVAPASLRDFMTLRQFTDIFPKSHRTNPAVKDLYRELYVLRDRHVDAVRQDIAIEIKRSKQLKREYAQERRQIDDANVAGLDPVARQMEEEVCPELHGHEHLLILRSS